MRHTAIIGGTGLTAMPGLRIHERLRITTPWGETSAELIRGELNDRPVLFLPRHGSGHTVPPHRINYRANIHALKEAGARHIIAINAVGGIDPELAPGQLVIPDQIIDYTWGRESTFFDGDDAPVVHVDFTEPYCARLRERLLAAAARAGIDVVAQGVYGATQGPRLETAAEIRRMARDGCTLVGMTGMPEAVLARELDCCYASIAVVANLAAGLGEGEITMEEIEKYIARGMDSVGRLLRQILALPEEID
ncbi:MAG TPA: S-methyl-5'-thioinosine phosphorylase [Gammaproteobacteria bacterium]|nr:S-methyl-5'-thioinosine phosphorylase [Gammaproteobacteria bacterium]